jgi:hypothetical protein
MHRVEVIAEIRTLLHYYFGDRAVVTASNFGRLSYLYNIGEAEWSVYHNA